jgi:hypothetical protein
MPGTERIHSNRRPLAPIHFSPARAPRKRILRMTPLRRERARELVHAGLGCVVRGCVDPAVRNVAAHAGD